MSPVHVMSIGDFCLHRTSKVLEVQRRRSCKPLSPSGESLAKKKKKKVSQLNGHSSRGTPSASGPLRL